MKGRQILIEPLPAGGHAAALMVDGRLEDLLVDPDPADPAPRPEAIYRAVPARPMKGLGGVIVDLGGGISGFLRGPSPPPPGRPLLVQASGWAEPGKAAPVTSRLLLKGRWAILTPGAPGINVARSLRDPERRDGLAALAAAAMAGAEAGVGLILRSAAAAAGDAEIAAEIAGLRARLGRARGCGDAGAAAGRAGGAGRGAQGVARGRGGGARGGDGAGRRRGVGGGGGARAADGGARAGVDGGRADPGAGGGRREHRGRPLAGGGA